MASSAGCALRSGNLLSSQARASVSRQDMVCSCNTANTHAPVQPHLHPAARNGTIEILRKTTLYGVSSFLELSTLALTVKCSQGEGIRYVVLVQRDVDVDDTARWYRSFSSQSPLSIDASTDMTSLGCLVGGVAQLPCVLVLYNTSSHGAETRARPTGVAGTNLLLEIWQSCHFKLPKSFHSSHVLSCHHLAGSVPPGGCFTRTCRGSSLSTFDGVARACLVIQRLATSGLQAPRRG